MIFIQLLIQCQRRGDALISGAMGEGVKEYDSCRTQLDPPRERISHERKCELGEEAKVKRCGKRLQAMRDGVRNAFSKVGFGVEIDRSNN